MHTVLTNLYRISPGGALPAPPTRSDTGQDANGVSRMMIDVVLGDASTGYSLAATVTDAGYPRAMD